MTRPVAYRIAWIGAHLGDSWLWSLVAAWLWVGARRRRDGGHAALRTSLDAFGWAGSLVAAAGLTLAIKRRARRVRPGSGVGLYGRGADVYSFPSGHAMRMGVMSVWTARLSAPGRAAAAALALWVCISRVRLGIHYVGDVVGGYLLGLLVGWLVRRAVQ